MIAELLICTDNDIIHTFLLNVFNVSEIELELGLLAESRPMKQFGTRALAIRVETRESSSPVAVFC